MKWLIFKWPKDLILPLEERRQMTIVSSAVKVVKKWDELLTTWSFILIILRARRTNEVTVPFVAFFVGCNASIREV